MADISSHTVQLASQGKALEGRAPVQGQKHRSFGLPAAALGLSGDILA